MSEAVSGIGGCDSVEHGLDLIPETLAGAAAQRPEPLLDLGEDHLNGIEFRTVGWKEAQLHACGLNELLSLWLERLSSTTMSPGRS